MDSVDLLFELAEKAYKLRTLPPIQVKLPCNILELAAAAGVNHFVVVEALELFPEYDRRGALLLYTRLTNEQVRKFADVESRCLVPVAQPP